MNSFYVIAAALLVMSVACGLYRLYRGPHILDKALALDFIGIAGVGVLVTLVVYIREPMVLDLALLLALVSFVTALAFSKYLAKKEKKMNLVSMVLIVFGSAFILLAGLGLVKMPTFFMRMQTASKASTLGSILLLAGASLHLGSLEVTLKATAIVVFLLLTTPIATHALAEAAKQEKYDK